MWKERIQYQTYLYRDTSADLKKKPFEYPLVYGKNTHPTSQDPLTAGSAPFILLTSLFLVPRVPLPSAKPAGSLSRELSGEKTDGDTQRNPPRRLPIPVPNHYWYLIWRWCFGYPLVKVSIRAIPRSLVIWVSPVTLQNSCKIVCLFACFFRSVCWKAFPFRIGKPKISNLSKTLVACVADAWK